nr:hypothetical protein CFP56_10304 [Quercus suber]
MRCVLFLIAILFRSIFCGSLEYMPPLDKAAPEGGHATMSKNMIEEVLATATRLNGIPVTVADARVPLDSTDVTHGSVPRISSNGTSTGLKSALTDFSAKIPVSSTVESLAGPDTTGNASTVFGIKSSDNGAVMSESRFVVSSNPASRSDLTPRSTITSIAQTSTPQMPTSTTGSDADGGAGFTGATNLVLASNAMAVSLPASISSLAVLYLLSTMMGTALIVTLMI